MFNLPNLPVFLLAALILLLTPGPAVLYIVARSLDQGRVAGLVSVAGLSAGTWVHVLAATLGLSAILVSSTLAFSWSNIWEPRISSISVCAVCSAAMKFARRLMSSRRVCGAFSRKAWWWLFSTRSRPCSFSPFCRSSSIRPAAR